MCEKVVFFFFLDFIIYFAKFDQYFRNLICNFIFMILQNTVK